MVPGVARSRPESRARGCHARARVLAAGGRAPQHRRDCPAPRLLRARVRSRLSGIPAEPFVLDGEDWFALPDVSVLPWPTILAVVETEQQRLTTVVADIGRRQSPIADAERFNLVLGITCHRGLPCGTGAVDQTAPGEGLERFPIDVARGLSGGRVWQAARRRDDADARNGTRADRDRPRAPALRGDAGATSLCAPRVHRRRRAGRGSRRPAMAPCARSLTPCPPGLPRSLH